MTLSSLIVERGRSSENMPSPGNRDIGSSLQLLSLEQNSSPKALVRTLSFQNWHDDVQNSTSAASSIKGARPERLSLGGLVNEVVNEVLNGLNPQPSAAADFSSPKPLSELNAAATKLQKCYKSYRTRRNLADCAVVIEELWWKALDFASLKQSSVSFFHCDKHETAASRWARAGKRVAKVGKGLSKNEKAQQLALQHWLEAIDPRHRYGHNLHLYYDVWFRSESTEPFFYWLDVGAGREINLDKCPRSKLQTQLVQYLCPNERASYEVVVEDGKLVYKQSDAPVHTTDGSKWIFVLSATRSLYVGQKKKGEFQHSSFLAGGATTAAGRLVAKEGILKAIWPYSGHYLPTEENFKEFISFLEENSVDLTNVKRCSVDDDEFPSFKKDSASEEAVAAAVDDAVKPESNVADIVDDHVADTVDSDPGAPKLASRLSFKWTTGTGARIGCVRDYPLDLQSKALEHVNLSPRRIPSPSGRFPIPSPRPSPKVRLSPRLQYMGIPSPTAVALSLPKI